MHFVHKHYYYCFHLQFNIHFLSQNVLRGKQCGDEHAQPLGSHHPSPTSAPLKSWEVVWYPDWGKSKRMASNKKHQNQSTCIWRYNTYQLRLLCASVSLSVKLEYCLPQKITVRIKENNQPSAWDLINTYWIFTVEIPAANIRAKDKIVLSVGVPYESRKPGGCLD